NGLVKIRGLLDGMGGWDRAPLVGSMTSGQQKLKGQLNKLMGPISQILGSGTPQEGEARRMLDAITVSPTQDKEVALSNLEDLRQYVIDQYEQKLGSVVPGYQPASAAPAAKSLHDEADDLLKGQ